MNIEQHTDDYSRLQDLIQPLDLAMLVTKTKNQHLRSRPMLTAGVNGEGDIFFFTTVNSDLCLELTEHNYVNLSYSLAEGHSFVSVSGVSQINKDRKAIQELWRSQFEEWIEDGLDNRDLAILKISLAHAEHWSKSEHNGMLQKMLSFSNDPSDSAVHETIGSL